MSTPEEIEFVKLVYQHPGSKLNGGEAQGEHDENLWETPEKMGLIKCVGSYKWVPDTEKVLETFGINAALSDSSEERMVENIQETQ